MNIEELTIARDKFRELEDFRKKYNDADDFVIMNSENPLVVGYSELLDSLEYYDSLYNFQELLEEKKKLEKLLALEKDNLELQEEYDMVLSSLKCFDSSYIEMLKKKKKELEQEPLIKEYKEAKALLEENGYDCSCSNNKRRAFGALNKIEEPLYLFAKQDHYSSYATLVNLDNGEYKHVQFDKLGKFMGDNYVISNPNIGIFGINDIEEDYWDILLDKKNRYGNDIEELNNKARQYIINYPSSILKKY